MNNTSNINFTSNIRFVPYNAYRKIAMMPKTVRVEEMCQVADVEEVKKKGATNGVIYCIAGILKDLKEKDDFVFHWMPEEIFAKNPTRIQEKIEIEETLDYIAKNKEVKGFMIGGLSKDYPVENKFSKMLVKFLIAPFKKIKQKDFTMFFYQDARYVQPNELPQSAFVYNKKTDTYYVNCKKHAKEKWHDLLDKNQIRDHFDYISISPSDKVFICSEQVPNEFLNKPKH